MGYLLYYTQLLEALLYRWRLYGILKSRAPSFPIPRLHYGGTPRLDAHGQAA